MFVNAQKSLLFTFYSFNAHVNGFIWVPLRCDDRFFQSVCEVLSADIHWDPEPVSWLLRPLDFTLTLAEMLPSRICGAVGTVLGHIDPNENLSLTLTPQSISCQGATLLFSNVTRLRKLRYKCLRMT